MGDKRDGGCSYCPLRASLKIPVKKVREFPFKQCEDLGVHTILPLLGLTQTSKLSITEGLFAVSLLNFCCIFYRLVTK